MYRKFFCAIWIVLVCLFAGCDSGKDGIAVVNSQRVLTESEAGKAGRAQLEKIHQEFQTESGALQKEMDTAKDKKAAHENHQARLQETQRQFTAKQQEIFAILDKHYAEALSDVRAEKNLGIVLEAPSAVMRSYDENLDITKEVIAAMDKKPLQLPLPETPAKGEAAPPEKAPESIETQDISE